MDIVQTLQTCRDQLAEMAAELAHHPCQALLLSEREVASFQEEVSEWLGELEQARLKSAQLAIFTSPRTSMPTLMRQAVVSYLVECLETHGCDDETAVKWLGEALGAVPSWVEGWLAEYRTGRQD